SVPLPGAPRMPSLLRKTLVFFVILLSGTLACLPSLGQMALVEQQSVPVGLGARNLVAKDFNGDGYPDLAVVAWGVAGNPDRPAHPGIVSVLMNDGTGRFGSRRDYPVGFGPSSVDAADFNRDRIPDLIVANTAGNTVSLLYGKGD